MDCMFDHNHDGKLSPSERAERDYLVHEMTKNAASGHSGNPRAGSGGTGNRPGGSGNVAVKWIGFILVMIGANAFVYFPWFAVIMFVLGLILMGS